MSELRVDSYFDKFFLKLNLSIGNLGIKPIYFGSENGMGLLNHFNGADHLEVLGLGKNYFSSQKHNCLIIYGHINLNQLQLLKEFTSKNKSYLDLIIHIRGPLQNKLQVQSYFLCENLSDYIDVNLTYSKHPLDIEELCNMIEDIQRSRLNG